MARSDVLAGFVGEALAAGRGRGEITEALVAAGWSRAEAEAAVSSYADLPFHPPVPAPRPVVEARDLFRYGLMFVALGLAAWHLAALGHAMVDRATDIGLTRPGYVTSRTNRAIASLVVFGPIYALIRWRDCGAPGSVERRRSLVRRWAGSAILLITSLALLGNLAAVIYDILEDGTDMAFILKAVIVAVVAGGVAVLHRRDGQ